MFTITVITFLWNPEGKEEADGWFEPKENEEPEEPACPDDCGECYHCKREREPDQG